MDTSDKYVLVSTLEPVEKGMEFTKWPLHVTLVPWFTLPDGSFRAFDNALQNRIHNFRVQEPVGDKLELFGPNKDIRVRTLRKIGELASMHRDLAESIEQVGGALHDVWVKDLYQPHVTYTEDQGVDEGEKISLTNLNLIWGDINGNRRVEKVYQLPRNS